MDRRVTVARVQESCRILQQRGIQVGIFIMIGYEGEEEEDLQATVEHLKRSNPDVFLSTVAYPIKGTPYYDSLRSRLHSDLPWEQRSDRDWQIKDRHSRRYYGFVNHWMVGEFQLHRQRVQSRPNFAKMAKAFVHSRLGRLGMSVTRREVEA